MLEHNKSIEKGKSKEKNNTIEERKSLNDSLQINLLENQNLTKENKGKKKSADDYDQKAVNSQAYENFKTVALSVSRYRNTFRSVDSKGSPDFLQLCDAMDYILEIDSKLKEKNNNINNLHLLDDSMEDESVDLDESFELAEYTIGDLVDAVVRLSECAESYYDTHRGYVFHDEGKQRKEDANGIRSATNIFFQHTKMSMDNKVNTFASSAAQKEKDAVYYKVDKSDVKRRLNQLAGLYKDWAKNFAKQEGSERERIKEKLALFQPYEREIRIYRNTHPEIKDKTIAGIIALYDSYRLKENVLSRMEKKDEVIAKALKDPVKEALKKREQDRLDHEEEKELDKKKVDATLTSKQLEAIARADRWFLRNFENSGVFGKIFGMKNHHAEIVTQLMSKSKRERLFIYYLIETGARKNPQVYDAYQSQYGYTPNIKKLKDTMLASKLKFKAHLTGSYVYMQKLSEAMQINRDYKSLIESTVDIKQNIEAAKKERKAKPSLIIDDSKEKKVDVVKERQKLLGEFFLLNLDYKKAAEEYLKEGNKKKKAAKQREMLNVGTECEKLRKRLFEVDDELKNKNNILDDQYKTELKKTHSSKGSSKSKDFMSYTKEYTKWPKKFVSDGAKLTKEANGLSWNLSKSELAKFNFLAKDITGGSLAFIGNSIGLLSAVLTYVDQAKDLTNADRVANLLDIFQKAADSSLSAYKNYEGISQFLTNTSAVIEKGVEISNGVQVAGALVSTAGVAYNGYKAISGLFDMHNSTNATKYFNQKRKAKLVELKKKIKDKSITDEQLRKEVREARYDANMAKLAEKISEHKTIYATANMTLSTIGLVSLVLPGIGPIIASGIGIVGEIATSVIKTKHMHGIRKELFDDYMSVTSAYQDAEKMLGDKKRKIRNPEKFKESLRRRLAAQAGFSDLSNAADEISKDYGNYVYKRLFNTPDNGGAANAEDKAGYIQLVKALGLRYEEEDKKPAAKLIAKKLAGR